MKSYSAYRIIDDEDGVQACVRLPISDANLPIGEILLSVELPKTDEVVLLDGETVLVLDDMLIRSGWLWVEGSTQHFLEIRFFIKRPAY